MPSLKGAGTLNSPIAIDQDDSEDEVFNELIETASYSTPSTRSPLGPSDRGRHESVEPPKIKDLGKHRNSATKRKRADSVSSLDHSVAGPSHASSQPQSLEDRLSAPESKKSRKRKRKADLRRQECADRLRRLEHAPHLISPYQMLDSFGFPYYQPNIGSHAIISSHLDFTFGGPPFSMKSSDNIFGDPYFELEEPPPIESSSTWVDSMVHAAEQPNNIPEMYHKLQPWAPPISAPPPHIPPPPLPAQPSVINDILVRPSSPKFLETHALPPKPPPQANQIIGMKPDQDPNSTHGIFYIPESEDQGNGANKQPYIPNPARTLVMEQMSKSHRNADFINNWSKKACGAYPVQSLIDGAGGKALIEFATAELARKAWGSPKLGNAYAGLKSHQLKGKPREDLIKVWWYRVDGIGAGAGVGEIEEGEIEGDAGEKEVEVPVKKETKKERKARLAKERDEKRMKREQELVVTREKQVSTGFTLPGDQSVSFAPTTLNSFTYPAHVLYRQQDTSAFIAPNTQSTSWPITDSNNGPSTSLNGHVGLKADSTKSANSPSTSASMFDPDIDEDMELEGDEAEIISPVNVMHLPVHDEHIPAYPAAIPPSSTMIFHPHTLQSSLHNREPLPPSTLPQNPTRIPSEPRAMKNAPTAPSHLKRSQEAKRKELEEKITRSKLELERAKTLKTSHPTLSSPPLVSPEDPKPAPVTSSSDAEARLRDLVLKSQKARNRPPPLGDSDAKSTSNIMVPNDIRPSPPSLVIQPAVPSSTRPVSLQEVPAVKLTPPNPPATSLGDLAVSFIEEALETAKTKPVATTQNPTIASRPPSRADTIAAIEQRIAETKDLMEKHRQATTKQEKDAIMAILKNRAVMEDSKKVGSAKPTTSFSSTPFVKGGGKATTSRWLNVQHDSGVLVVSDDEDDD